MPAWLRTLGQRDCLAAFLSSHNGGGANGRLNCRTLVRLSPFTARAR